MSKIKLIIISIATVLLLGLCSTACLQQRHIKRINKELSAAVINSKAYEVENSSLKEKTIQFEYTVNQLNYSKDSLVQKLNNVRKQLAIKDKNIKELQYIASTNSKVDTIVVSDTIFKTDFQLDTLIKDDWSSLQLKLSYPNLISANYSFKNETSIITASSRKTIKEPKKF